MEVPTVTRELDNEDKALKNLVDTFSSSFSLEEIASAFCKAGRDANLAGEILCETRTNPPADTTHLSKALVKSETSSQASNDTNFNESFYTNGNSYKAARLKRNSASMGTVSSVLGKNYVWRVVGSNGTANGSKPLKVEADGLPLSMNSCEESSSEDAKLNSSDKSSSVKDANLNDDIEDFLFEMLGRGFQLERSAIREVLGHCGYDMKKSLETLLDLTAVTLDRKNNFHEGSNGHLNSETLSCQNQVEKQQFAESPESRTMGSSGILSSHPTDRYEQQKEVLTSLFHVPERPDSIVSAPVLASARLSRGTRAVVSEPLEDFSDDHKVKATSLHLVNVKDESEEGSYQILRKAVKEHRDTMKEYYKAAAEAFASGDRARAGLLLEKGQFFYNKAREADEESAMKIFETSNEDGEIQDEMPLDLQGLDPKEAISLVKCHLRQLSGIPSIKNLKIVIGNGELDVPKCKRLVIKLLERAAIKWIEDDNSGTLLIRLDEINPKKLSFGRK